MSKRDDQKPKILYYGEESSIKEKLVATFGEEQVHQLHDMKKVFEFLKKNRVDSIIFETFQKEPFRGVNCKDLDILLYYGSSDESLNKHLSFLPIDPTENQNFNYSTSFYEDLYERYLYLLPGIALSEFSQDSIKLCEGMDLLSSLVEVLDDATEELDKKLGRVSFNSDKDSDEANKTHLDLKDEKHTVKGSEGLKEDSFKAKIEGEGIEQDNHKEVVTGDGEEEDKSKQVVSGGEEEDKSKQVVSGGEEEDKSKQVISGSGEEEDKSKQVVSGGGEEDNSKQVISGGGEEEDKSKQVISGGGEEDKSKQVISGGEEEDKSKQVVSGGEEEDKSKQVISGSGEEEDKSKQVISGGGEEEDKSKQVISGGGEEEDKSKQVISGSGEEEDKSKVTIKGDKN